MIVDTQAALIVDKPLPTGNTGNKADVMSGFEALMAALILGKVPINQTDADIITGTDILTDADILEGTDMLLGRWKTDDSDLTGNKHNEKSAIFLQSETRNIMLQDEEKNDIQTGQQAVGIRAGTAIGVLPSNPVTQQVDDETFAERKITLPEKSAKQQNIQGLQKVTGMQETAREAPVQAVIQTEGSMQLRKTQIQKTQIQKTQQAEERGQPIRSSEATEDSNLTKTDNSALTKEQRFTTFFRETPHSVGVLVKNGFNQETADAWEATDPNKAMIDNLVATPVKGPTALLLEPLKVPLNEIEQELPRIIFSQQKTGQNGTGSKEFTIQLEPEEMGRMTVKLVSQEGVVAVRIYAESQDARSIIESSLQSLRESFEQNGIKCGSLDVELGGQYLNQSNSQQQYQWFGESYTDIPRGWADRQYYTDKDIANATNINHMSGNGIDYKV